LRSERKREEKHLIGVSFFEQYGGAFRQVYSLPPSFEEGAVNEDV